MPLIGAHVSIAGGIANAPGNAAAEGGECFQLFTRSPRGGQAPPMSETTVQEFRAACEEHRMRCWVVHAPYYINLASADERTRANSIRIIREELDRASRIGATYVMAHLGSAKDVGEARGVRYAIEGLTAALDGSRNPVQFLIEIAAGAGAVMGSSFEQLAFMIDGVEARLDARRCIGVCFDTQHAFAAGYDLRTPHDVDRVLTAFDATIGLDRLKMSHIQDSKVALDERKDRHEHIGRGHIGVAGLRAFVQHPAVRELPLILETERDGRKRDIRLLKKFRDT